MLEILLISQSFPPETSLYDSANFLGLERFLLFPINIPNPLNHVIQLTKPSLIKSGDSLVLVTSFQCNTNISINYSHSIPPPLPHRKSHFIHKLPYPAFFPWNIMPSQLPTSSNDLPMRGSITMLPLRDEWTLVTEEGSGELFVEAIYLRPRLTMRLVH